MASSWFLILAFKCLYHFAWPLVALVYPMCASVQAIETDSYAETKDLISYWILLSLIYLFEYAFMNLLPWFHLWPYVKLMIIFWLIIPDFGRASYIYNKLISSMKPQVVTWRLNNYWRKWFCKKDNFLMHAEKYMKENGTEALEKLIANKNTMCRPDAEATNEIIATDNKEMLKTNGERLQIEHKDIKDLDAIEKKEIPATKQTSGERILTEHKDIKDLEAAEKKEIHETKQDIPVVPKIGPSQNESSATVETKGTVEGDRAGGQIPRSVVYFGYFKTTVETKGTVEGDRAGGEIPRSSSTQKDLQKDRTCDLCLTTAEEILNAHFSGRKHSAALTKQKDAEAINEITATDDNKEILKVTNGDRLQTEHRDIKDLEAIEAKEIPATKQDVPVMPKILPSQMHHQPQWKPKEQQSDTVGGEVPESSTIALKEVQKEWACALCLVTVPCEKTLNSHLNGRKHRAACEAALKAKKLKIYKAKEEVKQENFSNKLNSDVENGGGIVNNRFKGPVRMQKLHFIGPTPSPEALGGPTPFSRPTSSPIRVPFSYHRGSTPFRGPAPFGGPAPPPIRAPFSYHGSWARQPEFTYFIPTPPRFPPLHPNSR